MPSLTLTLCCEKLVVTSGLLPVVPFDEPPPSFAAFPIVKVNKPLFVYLSISIMKFTVAVSALLVASAAAFAPATMPEVCH